MSQKSSHPQAAKSVSQVLMSDRKHWMLDPQKEVAEAARLVDRAAELGRSDAVALSAAAMALGLVVRDLDRAVVLLDRSLLLIQISQHPGFAARG